MTHKELALATLSAPADYAFLNTPKRIKSWKVSREYEARERMPSYDKGIEFGLDWSEDALPALRLLEDDFKYWRSQWDDIVESTRGVTMGDGPDTCPVHRMMACEENADDTVRENSDLSEGSIDYYRIAVCNFKDW